MEPLDFAWRKVYWQLRELAFKLEPGDPLGLTSRDIAAKFSVNIKTVTRAIRQLKAEGVLMTKFKHGTFVHPQRPSASRDGKIILHVVDGYEGRPKFSLLSNICDHLDAIAVEKECRVITVNPNRMTDVIDLLKEGQVFGAIVNTINGLEGATATVERLRSFGIKICALDDPLPGVDSIIYDNPDIGRQIGDILIHRLRNGRILALRNNYFANGCFDREEGFQKTLRAHREDLKVVWLNLVSSSHRRARLVENYMLSGIRFDCVFLPSPDIHHDIRNFCKSLKTPVPLMAAFGTREELEDSGIAGAYLDFKRYVGDAINLLFDQTRDPLRPPVVIKHKALTYIPV